jgi:hypothetical protein
MSEQQLFADLYRWLQSAVQEELRSYSPNLARATGVLKGASLPLSGPAPVGTTGTGYPASPHTHDFGDITGELDDAQHGDRGGGNLHAVATGSVAGFQAAADKAKSDLYPAISGLTTGHVLTATGAATVAFAAPAGGFSSPLTTRGDLLTRDASAHVRLAVGAAGTFLRSDGTDPSWATVAWSDLSGSAASSGDFSVGGQLIVTSNVSLGGDLSADEVHLTGALDAQDAGFNGTLYVVGTSTLAGAVSAASLALTTPLPAASGGTGVSNAGTLTVGANATISGGGTLALGGFTLTAPATGTAALRASAATAGRIGFWSSATEISHDASLAWDGTNKRLLLPAVPAAGNIAGIDFAEGGTSYANFQAWNNNTNSFIFFNVNRYWDGTGWNAQNARAAFSIQLSDTQVSLYSFAAGSNTLNLRLTLTNAGVLNLPTATSVVQIAGTQILTSRRTGWGAPTGTATRTTFATTTVTLPQLAERVKALIDDLTTHGVIGA